MSMEGSDENINVGVNIEKENIRFPSRQLG